MDRMNDQASNRIERTASAPVACAFATIRSTLAGELSSRSVYSLISPPNKERIPATMFIGRLLVRTTSPNTSPLVSTTRWPATFQVVLTSIGVLLGSTHQVVGNATLCCRDARDRFDTSFQR